MQETRKRFKPVLIGGLATGVLSSLTACSSSTAGQSAPSAEAALPETVITVTDRGCEPGELAVTAGKHLFVITNQSSRPLEWEILDGVKVVEERENIAPGFTQKLKATLNPQDYAMTCGLLSNPKGKIRVTAAK